MIFKAVSLKGEKKPLEITAKDWAEALAIGTKEGLYIVGEVIDDNIYMKGIDPYTEDGNGSKGN